MAVFKVCSGCRESKPCSEFYRRSARKDGLDYYCKVCKKERSTEWYRQNSLRIREGQLLQQYGITLEDYEALLKSQGGVCAICAEGCPTGKRLAVDHCHETGTVRGLLCARCNNGLGNFRDRQDLLARASDYIAARVVV